MKTHVTFDRGKVPGKRSVRIRAMLKIEAEKPEGEARRPLNIGVVLDRSGSMRGAKIHSVREATKALAGKLGGDDVFSLTIFDDVIETVVAPRRMGDDLESLESAVDGIEARNKTDLCGGYKAGCENVLMKRGNGALDRVLLLTDGLANVGITNPMEIARTTRDMAERGIVTSTVGVGADYSEDLLGRMAEAGGGNTYFLQSAIEVEEVLEEELGSLFSLAAQGLRVRFEPAVEGVKASQLNSYRTGTDGAWVLGDVYGGQTKTLVLELEIPPTPLGKKVRFGNLHLSCEVTAERGMREFSESLPLDLDAVTEEEFASQAVDTEVTLQAVDLTVAAARTRAWELADHRDFEGAGKALSDCAEGLERVGLSDPRIARHVENLRTEARKLEFDREGYFTPMMKKQMYVESRLAGHGKFSHLDRMRARHSGYGAGGLPSGCYTFALYDVGGHFLAEIGTGRFLVDTGWPISIGDGSPLVVGSRRFDLKKGAGVADASSISRDIQAQVTGILGADILGQFDVVLDIGAGVLVLDENSRPLPGKVVKADFASGLPVLSTQIDGVTVPMVLSTGSRISFLRLDLAAGGEIVGRDVETIAGLGEYETEMRKVSVRLGDRSYSIEVGTLPPTLERTLSVAGVAGVLGAKLFNLRKLGVSARQGIVTITDERERQA